MFTNWLILTLIHRKGIFSGKFSDCGMGLCVPMGIDKLGSLFHRVWYVPCPGVGIFKGPFVNFSVSKNFDPAKVPARFLDAHSYLTGVNAAELRLHLSNINVIFHS